MSVCGCSSDVRQVSEIQATTRASEQQVFVLELDEHCPFSVLLPMWIETYIRLHIQTGIPYVTVV